MFFDGVETTLSQQMYPQQSEQSQRSSEDFTGCVRRLREYDDTRTSEFCGWIRSWWRTNKLQKFLTGVIGDDPARLRKFWSDLSQHATSEERAAVVQAMSKDQKEALQRGEIGRLNEVSASLEEARTALKTLEAERPVPEGQAQKISAAQAKIAQLEADFANACDEAIAFAETDPSHAEEFWRAFRGPTTPPPLPIQAAIAEVEKHYNARLDSITTEISQERAKLQEATSTMALGSVPRSEAQVQAIREAEGRIAQLEVRRTDAQKTLLRFAGDDPKLLQRFWARYMPAPLPETATIEQRQIFANECAAVRSLLSPKQNEVLQAEEIRLLNEVSEKLAEARTALKNLKEQEPPLLETDPQITTARDKVTGLEAEVTRMRHEAISFVESNPVIDRNAFLKVAGNDPEILHRYWDRCMPAPLPETATKQQRLAHAQECRTVTGLLSDGQRRVLQHRLVELLPKLVGDLNRVTGPLKLAREAFKTELKIALENTNPKPSDNLRDYLTKKQDLVTAREALENHENELRELEVQLAKAKIKVPKDEAEITRLRDEKDAKERQIVADRERITGLEREVTAAKEAIKKPLQEQLARDQERLRLAEKELEDIKERLRVAEQREPRNEEEIRGINKEKAYAERGVEISRERVEEAQRRIEGPENHVVDAIERSGNSLYAQEEERRRIMGALATAEREAAIIGGTTNMPPGMMKAFTTALRSQDVGGGGSLAIIQGGARSTADILFPDSAEERRLQDEEQHRLKGTSLVHN